MSRILSTEPADVRGVLQGPDESVYETGLELVARSQWWYARHRFLRHRMAMVSLLLLTEGAVFAPFVFLGAVLTDVFITGAHHSLSVTIAAELVATVGYAGLAAILRHKLKFNPRRVRLADVVVL